MVHSLCADATHVFMNIQKFMERKTIWGMGERWSMRRSLKTEISFYCFDMQMQIFRLIYVYVVK